MDRVACFIAIYPNKINAISASERLVRFRCFRTIFAVRDLFVAHGWSERVSFAVVSHITQFIERSCRENGHPKAQVRSFAHDAWLLNDTAWTTIYATAVLRIVQYTYVSTTELLITSYSARTY